MNQPCLLYADRAGLHRQFLRYSGFIDGSFFSVQERKMKYLMILAGTHNLMDDKGREGKWDYSGKISMTIGNKIKCPIRFCVPSGGEVLAAKRLSRAGNT